MKIIILSLVLSLPVLANYQISSHKVDGITITQNQAPSSDCKKMGTYTFTAKYMAKDEVGIVKEAKKLKGNFVVESYDNYPSPRHHGVVYSCP